MFVFRWQQRTKDEVSRLGEWWVIVAAGIGIIAMGLLIALFPAILVALVAGLTMTVGIYIVSLGMTLRPRDVSASPRGESRRVEVHQEGGKERYDRDLSSW